MSQTFQSDAAQPDATLSESVSGTDAIALSLAQIAVWQLDTATWQVSYNEDCARLLALPFGKTLAFAAFVHALSASHSLQLETSLQEFLNSPEQHLSLETGSFLFKAQKRKHTDPSAHLLTGVVLPARPTPPAPFISEYQSRGTDVGLFQIDLIEETISYTPALAKNLTGAADMNLSRNDFIRHIHPEDLPLRAKAYEEAMRTGDLHYEGRTIWNDGSIHWVRTIGSYNFNDARQPVTFFGIVQDITKEKLREQELRETESRFRNMIHQAPMAMALIMGRDLIVEVGNDKIFELWGKPTTDLGKPLLEILPEIADQPFPTLLLSVLDTGQPYVGENVQVELVRFGRLETAYFDFTYTPLRNQDDAVNGIMVLANEVTAQVLARKKVEDSEQHFISLIKEAPFATALYKGPEMVIDIANDAMIELWGKDDSVIGKKLALALPELEGQPFLDLLQKVYATGEAHHEKEARADLMVNGVLANFFFNYTYKPVFDAFGRVYAVLNMAFDVTAQVLAHRKLEESELFARSIIYNSPVGKLVLTGASQTVSIANENLLQLFGQTDAVLNQPFRTAFPNLYDGMHQQLMHVLQTGETFTANEASYQVTRAGQTETGYFNLIFKALPSAVGGYYGVIITVVDVTEQVRNRTRIAEAKEALKGAIELAELGTWEMNWPEQMVCYSDRLANWMGVAPDVPTPLSAAMASVHPDDQDRVQQLMDSALSKENYNSFNAEYRLIQPQTGTERIIHAQGMTYFDGSDKPVKMTGTARDVTQERQTHAALELEVKKRTAELNLLNMQLMDAVSELAAANEQLKRSNEDLAQYAHVASHDLQEPLRKIRMFSGMLLDQPAAMPVNGSLVQKINESAARMSLLIKDLLDYSRLLKTEDLKKKVDLNEVIRLILVDFELKIQEKKAIVTVDQLPEIDAVPLQMSQLFFNLIGNALKFSLADKVPEIHIGAGLMTAGEMYQYMPLLKNGEAYYHLTIRDNGIGFEEKYAQQIFEVFKRLHGRDIYPGSGIGLALCRRIVDNHQGSIFATSEPGTGTTFHILLPAGDRTVA